MWCIDDAMQRKSLFVSVVYSFRLFLLACILMFEVPLVQAAEVPAELEGVGITEHLGSRVRIEKYSFKDDQGQSVRLADYFQEKKPVILALVYYQCPQLCNLILNGLQSAMKDMAWTAGKEFELIAVSINPTETPELASQKKKNYLKAYNRPSADQGFHFLTGDESQIKSLADEVGFHYRYEPKEKQYLHTATLFILTPEGKISRYLYGVSFTAKNLRLALTEASRGMVGTVMDRILMFCYHFDPSKNSYTFQMWRVVQIVLTIQAIALGGILYKLWRSEKRRKSEFDQSS
ncbi:SCO family protein [bacterium]|nr:SCO family protein [bacterium]